TARAENASLNCANLCIAAERNTPVRDSPRRAHEIPLAPSKRFMERHKVRSRRLANQSGLAEPLCVRADFVLRHVSKRIQFIGNPTDNRNLRDEVNEGQKRSA